MKLKPAKKRLQESFTQRDLDLWNKYCWATQSNEYGDVPEDVLYTIDDIPDIIDRAGGDPETSFWNGVDSINIRGSKYLTCAGGIFRGLSEREVSHYLSDHNFLEWKREHGYSTSAD